MAKRYEELSDDHIEFINHQKISYVETAANDGTINVSPKGFNSSRVLSPNRIMWMNITGSSNETTAHLSQNNRMTMTFCAFDRSPKILRLYGKAEAIHPRDDRWTELGKLFNPHPSARQYADFSIELIQTSCGFGAPFYDFTEERDNMDKWLEVKGRDNIEDYWKEKNQVSLDGLPTHIIHEKDED
jgi:hypothetical protein